jgi:pimeloyl-ACP methyl ester carboxylesterase
MTTFPSVDAWHRACTEDAVLRTWAGDWSITFRIVSGETTQSFQFRGGVPVLASAEPAFTLKAPESVWSKFLQPVPPRHHHGIFALHYRVPEFTIEGDQLAFMQFVHVVRRVLDIGKWLALGHTDAVPLSLAPETGNRPIPFVQAGYVPVTAQGVTYQVYYETAGQGQDILCMHTAGADGRQFHGLMADERIVAGHRLIAFDLPWHGKSPPPAGAIPGSWRLNTDLYVALIMGVMAALKLKKPIALGASMSGEICLELAYRHASQFKGIIACEACDKIERRQTGWAAHPQVNQSLFVPEWIRALCAPQSPAEWQEAIAWHYAQGGPAVFYGDIAFYSGDWDARKRVGRIDTSQCRLFMLTGEYDYSCTSEMSAATAAKIPGAVFREMKGIGHFPFAENPQLFAEYLRPVLDTLASG